MHRPSVSSLVCLFFLFTSCFLLGAVRGAVIPPVPPLQNAVQAQVWQNANTRAAEASAAATPVLLEYLDSQLFRNQIVNLTMFAAATAEELLNELRAIVLETPLHHNFPIVTSGFALDVNLTEMIANGFVPNLYTAVLEGLLPSTVISAPEDLAEVHLMGFPEFANTSSPTLAEALNRPQYLCINSYRVAGGCIAFGQMSIVVQPSARNFSIISPIDTGSYTLCCLTSGSTATDPATINPVCNNLLLDDMNCSAWNQVVATFENFDHIFLANSGVWGLPLGGLLLRKYTNTTSIIAQEGNLKGFLAEFLGYYEGDLAGAIVFPESVHYLQAVTTLVIGTPWGSEAGKWATDNNWPLVWAMGVISLSELFNSSAPISPIYLDLDVNTMILHPFSNLGNLTISEYDIELAQKNYLVQWNSTEQILTDSPSQYLNGTFWLEVWRRFSSSMPSSLYVKYPTGACALTDNCFVASVATNECICNM